VTAKGMNDIADKIIDIAAEHGIPLQKNDGLVDVLSQMNLGEEIPENLYRAIAEVIAFAYILTGRFPQNYTP
jgi:flagellar biosynthesis protein